MTSEQASKMVVASLVVTTTIVILDEVGKGQSPKPRLFIAGGFLYLGLGLGSDFVPGVAGPMALLVALTVLLTRGGNALGTISKRLGAK